MAETHDPSMKNPTFLAPVAPAIENYLRGLTADSDHPVLADMEALAAEKNFPIVGRLVGLFLQTMAKSITARRVFEFGSGYGYSAYWFASAVGAEGRVICTDGDAENVSKAQQFLTRVKLWPRIQFHQGMAQDIFSAATGEFDICYNDVDKGDYPEIWRMARARIRPGGFYIADNVLWHGRVAVEEFVDIVPGWTEAIREHNEMIFFDPEFDAFINPIRDGVVVARKKTG